MYAEVADVLARAGRVSGAWSETTTPALSDLERFLDARQGEIDAALAGRGIAVPLTDETAAASLRSLHAAGALVLALPATFPNREGPAAAAELYAAVSQEWLRGLDAVMQGTHPAVSLAQAEGDGPQATSFFIENPDYGLYEVDEEFENPYLAPLWARSEIL